MAAPQVTTPVAGPRLTRVAVACGIALAVAFVVTLLDAKGSSTSAGRLGGDYPSFYASSRIVADGDVEDLYDADRLTAEQHEHDLLGDDETGFIGFPYAQYVAAAYRPLSALPYVTSYAVHTLLMVGTLVGALVLLRPLLPVVDRNFPVVVVLTLLFFPMFRAVGGGQNTSLSLLLVAASWRLLGSDRDVLAGVLSGLLLYKPQLAVPLVGLFVVAGRWRVLAGFVPVAAAVWLANAAVAGADWVSDWLDGVSGWGELEARFNSDNTISVPGVAEALFGHATAPAAVVGWSLAAAIAVGLAALWWRWRPVEAATGDLGLTMLGAAVAGVLLLSPHAVYYEAGLLVLPGLVLLDRGDRRERQAVALLWLAAWLHPLNSAIGATPVFGVAVAAFAITVTSTRRRHRTVSREGTGGARSLAQR